MSKITAILLRVLKIRIFEQSMIKRQIFNLFIALVILFSSSVSLQTKAASVVTADAQVCGETNLVWADGEEVKCRLLPESTDPSPISEQKGLALETLDTSESSTGIVTASWSVQAGEAGTNVKDIATDTNGYIYTTGYIDLVDDADAFVTKMDSNGNVVWSYSFTGMTYDRSAGIALDSSGNIYITGTVAGNTVDILLAKLNNDGILQWITTWGTASYQDRGHQVALDAAGNIYVTGMSGPWGSPLQPYDHPTPSGGGDIFVAKFEPISGNIVWNTFLGGNLGGFGFGIAVNSSGNIYVTGKVQPSNSVPDPSANVFVANLDADGNEIWYVALGATGDADAGRDITLDEAGNVYVVGESLGSWGSPLNPFSGSFDAFILKMDSAGSLQWNTFLGTTGFDMGYGIDLDALGNIYISGNSTNLWGNPFPSGTGEPQEVFTAKLDNNGTLQWNTFIQGEAWFESWGNANRMAVHDGSAYVISYITDSNSDSITFITKIDDQPYDCSGTTLSSIAQALLTQVGEQNYCMNKFEKFIFIEDTATGQTAFQEFAELASQADYEVDFTTMIWNTDAGEIFLAGVKELHTKVSNTLNNDPTAYPDSVRIRILLGLEHYTYPDQRDTVLSTLDDLEIPLDDFGGKWKVEVASYRNSKQGVGFVRPNYHGHVKLLVVDGKDAIVSGYNLQDIYLDTKLTDVGIQISGPIVQDALQVFDQLWFQARGLTCPFNLLCEYIVLPLEHASGVKLIEPAVSNPVNIFSLYRDSYEKTADDAISDAIRSATTNVNLLQNRYFENDPPRIKCIENWCFEYRFPPSLPNPGDNGPFPYTQPIIDAAQNGVQVRMLLSGTEEAMNLPSVENLRRKILLLPDGSNILSKIAVKFTKNPLHAKAFSIDGQFVVVGSQNFDFSAFGDDPANINDLAEYSVGVDNENVAGQFNTTFDALWEDAGELVRVDQSIQQTIDQATSGTIVYIPPGTYQESIIINKPLVLAGDSANQTIIQSEGSEPAFQVTSSDVTIMNMKISGGSGYGIELIDSSSSSLKNIQINHVVFENNAQGGVLAQGLIAGSPMNYTIENNTFIGGADGITVNMLETQADTSIVRNNIFSGQSNAPIHVLSADDSRVEYSYNLFNDCGLGACATNWVQGSISTSSNAHDNLFDLDPLFAGPENGVYQLLAGSPAIDAGDPELLHDSFYDGDNDGVIQIDIGSFEYVPVEENAAPVVNAGDDQTVDLGDRVAVNATYSDADNPENHSARIDWGDGMIEDVPVNMTGPGAGEVAGEHSYSSSGNYTVEVCVTDLYGAVGCDSINVEVLPPPTGTTEIKIGETYVLSNDDSGHGNLLVAQNVVLSQEATLQSLSFYVTTAAGNLRLGIYNDANGNPGTLVAKTDEFTPVVGWNTQSVQTPVLLPAGTYWLAYRPESNDLHFRNTWTGDGENSLRYYSYPYGEMPSTFSTSAQSADAEFSFYATFTVAVEPGTIYVGEVNVLHFEADGSGNHLIMQETELPNNAVLQSVSFYVTNAVGKIRLGIYDNNWLDRPETLMAETDEFTPVVGWNTVDVQTPTLLPAGTYWLAFLIESDDLEFKYAWVQGLYTGRVYGYPFGEMPSSISQQPVGVEYHFSLYATFMEDDSLTLPATEILDDFNRTDGSIGSNWSGDTAEFNILSNQLTVTSYDAMVGWNGTSFGADQEAYVTLSGLDTGSANEHGLVLKAQSANTMHDGAIQVVYDGSGERIQVWTYTPGYGWAKSGSDIPAVFVEGDVFSARALSNGWLDMYRNGTLIGKRNLSAWPYMAQGGYIGLKFYQIQDAVVDDFGGGTLEGGEALMGMTSSVGGSESPDAASEFIVLSSQFNANAKTDSIFGQSAPAEQKAYITFPPADSGRQNPLEKTQEKETKEGTIQVVFDVTGGRIQILIYDPQQGWIQRGRDISAKFADGDRFRASLSDDGTLEIYRNGKLVAKRDVLL